MRRHISYGDGEWCPQDATHGRMWTLASGANYCPHSAHRGTALYLDGTPVAASQPTPEALVPLASTTAQQTSLAWEGAGS